MTPRAVTSDELRDKILQYMRELATYWATIDGEKTIQDRINGALFSTLAMLDGCTLDLPAFDLVARPHETDKQFHINRSENWVDDGTVISYALHEYWNKTP